MRGEFIFGSTERPFTGRKMATVIVGFFLTIIVVNAIFAWFALSTWTGLETESAYDKGLRHNESLAAASAQKARGWRIAHDLQAISGGKHRLRIDARDKSGAALNNLIVSVHMRRPTKADLDFELILQSAGDGAYQVEFAAPALGNWDMVLLAQEDTGDRHRTERRLWLK